MTRKCECGDVKLHAMAVSSAVFQSLMNAWNDRRKEEQWRAHADKLESKFTTEHGRHYSDYLGGVEVIDSEGVKRWVDTDKPVEAVEVGDER